MSSSLDDPTATNPQTPSNHSERTTTLINEIRHLEKSTNEALRTTQDELERLESTSSQTRSTIDHLERKLKVLEKQNNNNNGYTSRRNSDNSNGGGGGGVNKRLNSFLNRSITIHGGNEQLEELRSRRSLIRRGHSISNLRESMRESIIGRGNNSNDAYHHHQDGPPPTTRRRNRSSMNLRSSTMSRSINTSGHSFSLGVSNHTRLTHLLSGLATHDSGDEESSTCSDATAALDLLPSSSSSSSSSSCDSDDKGNSSTQSCSLNKQQLSQINELSSTLQLKKDQLHQLQHDQQTNATKLSMVQSKLYKVHREHRQLLQDHECKMKVLQEVHKNKWCHEYVDMRSNSVVRAEERLDVWRCRIEELEAKVFAVGGGRKKGGQALMMSPLLKSIQDEIRRYQIRIKVQEYKQQIMDSFLAGLEKSNEIGRLDNGQHPTGHQHQGEDGSSSDSDYSASSECPTGGEEASSVDESEEDLSYIIGREEGLSLIHSVEDSDISETATEEEEEEESLLSSIPSVQTNTNSPQTSTTTTTQRQRHLTVLITGGNFNLTQTANQRSTLQLLADLSLPHVTIDGMDPSQRERRNELFGVSGIRGNYPQIFVSSIVVGGDNGEDGGVESEDVFLGGYEWLECCDLDELRELLVVKVESGRDGNAGEEMKDEPRHDVNAVDIEGHLRSLEKSIKIMEGRVKDFEILSCSTFNRQQCMDEYDVHSMNAANRLYSLTRQCTNVLENFTTKTSDIISSSLEMQPTALTSNDQDTSANTATADYEVNTTIQQELIIAQIEQTKVHLTQLEQSRDACNADIEQLKNDIESMEVAMEEQNESNYELFTEIQTKLGMLTKRLEVGSNEIRCLVKEIKEWSSREEEFLLKAQPSRGIGFIR